MLLHCRKCKEPISLSIVSQSDESPKLVDFMSLSLDQLDRKRSPVPSAAQPTPMAEQAPRLVSLQAPLSVHDKAMALWKTWHGTGAGSDNDYYYCVCSRCALHLTAIIDWEVAGAEERRRLAVTAASHPVTDYGSHADHDDPADGSDQSKATRTVVEEDSDGIYEAAIGLGEMAALIRDLKSIDQQISSCSSFDPLRDLFGLTVAIASDGSQTAHINGAQLWPLGRDCETLNSAYGQLSLLLWCLARKRPQSLYKIVPMGPASRLDRAVEDGRRLSFDLFQTRARPFALESIRELLLFIQTVLPESARPSDNDVIGAVTALKRLLLETDAQ